MEKINEVYNELIQIMDKQIGMLIAAEIQRSDTEILHVDSVGDDDLQVIFSCKNAELIKARLLVRGTLRKSMIPEPTKK